MKIGTSILFAVIFVNAFYPKKTELIEENSIIYILALIIALICYKLESKD